MNEEAINQIAAILGSSGSAAVTAYVKWFVIEAIAFIAIAIGGIAWVLRWKPVDWNYDFGPGVIRVVFVGVCLLVIGCHVADIFAPQAIAIHQLLSDVRG